MLNEIPRNDAPGNGGITSSTKLLAIVSALLVTGALLGGYFYLRSRFTQQRAINPVANEPASSAPRGAAKVQVFLDDPLLKNRESIIGGMVRNISAEPLQNLEVILELRKRKDGEIEERTINLEPSQLAPNQEGRYEIRLMAQEYIGVRLAGVKSDSALIAHSSAPGQRRPPEVTPSKTVTVQRPVPDGEEFLNTPDNPGRVP